MLGVCDVALSYDSNIGGDDLKRNYSTIGNRISDELQGHQRLYKV